MGVYDISGLVAGGAYVNVKDYGAVGDGVTDDAAAIQSALDSISVTGGVVFFPNGTYLIKQYLFYYSNQTLYFENGATLLQGAAINALLIAAGDASITEYNGTHDVIIDGGIFDGGAYTTNNTLLGCSHSRNITIRNCKFINSYGTWHNVEINSTKHAIIENCEFEGLRKTGGNGCMIQVDSFYSTVCYPWGTGAVDSTPSQFVEIKSCRFYDNTTSPAIGNHSTGGSYVRVHDCIFEGLTSSRGAICFQGITDLDVYNNTFVDCTTGVANANAVVHDNRFIGCTTPINASATAYNNMVNGALVAGSA